MAERFVLGNEEAAADEPRADGPTAVEKKDDDGNGGIGCKTGDRERRLADRRTAPHEDDERERDERAADRPGFVARHARGGDRHPAARGVRSAPPSTQSAVKATARSVVPKSNGSVIGVLWR